MKKKTLYMLLRLSVIATLCTGCAPTNTVEAPSTTSSISASMVENESELSNTNDVAAEALLAIPEGGMPEAQRYTLSNGVEVKFSSYDLLEEYDEASAYNIELQGTGAQVTAPEGFVTWQDKQLFIQRGGTYVITGTLSDGQIYIAAPDTEKVQLVLAGANITSLSSAPIVAQSCDKLILTLKEGTENFCTDASIYTDDLAKGCISSSCNLTINGAGALTVQGNYNNGISTKGDLRITNGVITVSAENNALKGNDSVCICGGNITINRCDDGIKSDKEDHPEKGFVFLCGGSIAITADDDCIQATLGVFIDGAYVYGRCYGKTVNCDGFIEGQENIKTWL